MGICLDIQNNLKIRGIVVVPAYPGCLWFFFVLYPFRLSGNSLGNFLGFV